MGVMSALASDVVLPLILVSTQEQLLFWTGSMLTWEEELQDLHLLHHLQQQLLLQNLDVLTIGLKMDIVMMKITMLNANLMVEIVATIAWKTGTFIAVIAPV